MENKTNEITNININQSSCVEQNIKPQEKISKEIEKLNQKEYLIEHYIEDPEVVKEYKELFSPIKKRLKY